MAVRTSDSHPLRIDVVTISATGGQIGITFCPGKKQIVSLTGCWDRDLEQDMLRIAEWTPDAMLTLIESHEFDELGVARLPNIVKTMGLEWHHLPIKDMDVPDVRFEQNWVQVGKRLRQYLINGGRVLVHCKGGLGRAGTITARLLVELGEKPESAIAQVRLARKRTIETGAQENHVRGCTAAASFE